MELSKLTFVGTADEFTSVAHLFAGPPLGDEIGDVDNGGIPTHDPQSHMTIPRDENEQVFLRVLQRLTVPAGQIALYKALYQAGDKGLPAARLAATMGRTEQELSGVLGALGRRINRTEGINITNPPGITLFFDISRIEDEWHYRMVPLLRTVLEQEGALQDFPE